MVFDIALSRRIGDIRISVDLQSDARITAIVGPSGSGKTSLLNMVAGLTEPDTGHVRVLGRLLCDVAGRVSLPPEERRAGCVFQEGRLFPHLSVRANLIYGLRGRTPPIGFDELVGLLGIGALLNRRPRSLSGGEARRVAIGRALLMAPDFLLMDEPLTSLDAARREDMLHIIERIRDLGVPILYVSHQADEISRLAGHVHEMQPSPVSMP